jgi:RNA polymerase sigma factor (sigma-70 family)
MATNQLKQVIQTLREASRPPEAAGPTDGQLLESYVSSREETAFAALVYRHGPMVWGVCRRVLQSHQDAEDAFQATFLVLVRKAASVLPRELVGNWLYGVAHQTALKARSTSVKRRTREKQVTAMPEPALEQQKLWNDLQPLLDRELSRLPNKYRAVIVLCDLEGKTRKEAAQHFNLPEGTVATRLATARTMLAKRLARSGLVLSGAALGVALSRNQAAAGMPAWVATTTIRAGSLFAAGQAAAPDAISIKAVALAEGVLKNMLLSKLKIATAVLLALAFLGAGAAALTLPGPVGKPADLASGERQRPELLLEKPEPAKEKKEPVVQPVKEKDEPIPPGVSGVVLAVDAEKHTLTVAHNLGDSNFCLTKDAKIEVDGKPGTLAALPTGACVHLNQFVDPRTAGNVRAEGRNYWGVLLKEVDAAKNSIIVADKEDENTYSVAADARILVDGKNCPLAAVPKGCHINLSLAADQKTARSIDAAGPYFSGVVKAVDPDKRIITVHDKTYDVAADADIGIDNKPGQLAAVPVGANVNVSLHVDGKTVGRLQAYGRSVFAAVKGVDSAKSTITVAGSQDDGLTFRVTKDTYITLDGKPSTLAAIPVGASLHALNLCADQQTASGINVVGPGFHNIPVTAVDAGRHTITFGTPAPPELAGKTVSVAPDANITIDAKPGRLAGVPPGSFVNVGLSVDRQTALNLQVEGPNLGGCGGSPVTAVDAVNGTITFGDKGAAEVAGKTFPVSKNAYITIDNRPGKLVEIAPGCHVNLTLTVDRQTARCITAQGPSNICDCGGSLVKAIDVEKGTITFADQARAEVAGKTFTVAKDANIGIDGKPGKLAELPVGCYVNLGLSADQRLANRIFAQGPPVAGVGVVKAVDLEKNTITVDDKTYPVASNANILINGKTCNLAGVPTGVYVTLRLCIDRQTVGTIFQANAP